MTTSCTRWLVTFYTRTPLHVGSGSSVEVVDLPIARERVTGFPVIPATALKGVLLQRARELWHKEPKENEDLPEEAKILFGDADGDAEIVEAAGEKKQVSNAGCLQIMEGKLLCFPVRSLAGCFAWLSCPTTLQRLGRDIGRSIPVPRVSKEKVLAGEDLWIHAEKGSKRFVVLEEYALEEESSQASGEFATVAQELQSLCQDSLWRSFFQKRLALVHDEEFQHFVSSSTEIVARIRLDPWTRTNKNLFYQENVPCETLFYSVLTLLPPRRSSALGTPQKLLDELLPSDRPILLQIGGDETTGHGMCEAYRRPLDLEEETK